MSLELSTTEIWQIAVIKLLFYLFIGLGILFFFKLKKPIIFITLLASFLSATYLVMIQKAQLLWWGLQGDEIFVGAFLERVAGGQFFSDFFYSNLPAFYPPLYFWLIGGLAFLLGANGIIAGHLGVTLVLFVTPFLVYFWQKYYWQGSIASWRLVLTTALVFVVVDWSAVIFKPYEFISAVLICFWLAFLLPDLYLKTLSQKKLLFYGLSGGVLFLTFYFWFLPALLAVAIFKLTTSIRTTYYWRCVGVVVGLVVLVASPFILPLGLTYLRLGAENMQPAFFIIQDLNLYLPFLEFSIFGILSLVGLLTLIFYWPRPYIKALGSLLMATYIWQLINISTVIFAQTSFLPGKPFLFLGGAVLMVAAAYGIGELVTAKINQKNILSGLFIFGWLILATQLLGGNFIDDPVVQQRLVAIKQPLSEEIGVVIEKLAQVDDFENLTILSSGIPQISAYLPLNYYISYNIHFSHPAAHFSQRYEFLSELSQSQNEAEFYQKLKNAPFEPIEALLLFKGQNSYPLLFWLDNYPAGALENQIDIPSDLISERYFAKVFEDKHFVFYKVK